MKLEDITVKNIKNFFVGYSRFYYDKIWKLPLHIKEQVFYRIYTCKDSCLLLRKCEICTCPTIERAYSTQSCNPSKFPDLMSEDKWFKFKQENKISQPVVEQMMIEVEKVFKNKV